MKKVLLSIYRIIYGASSALILAGAVTEMIRYRGLVAKPQLLLLCLFALTAAFELFAIFFFLRVSVPLLWTGTALFCGFFAWYGWYSLPAPFVQHETHTFDPVQAAAESSRFKMQAGITYGIIVVWFMTLPLLRQFLAKPNIHSSGPRTRAIPDDQPPS